MPNGALLSTIYIPNSLGSQHHDQGKKLLSKSAARNTDDLGSYQMTCYGDRLEDASSLSQRFMSCKTNLWYMTLQTLNLLSTNQQ